ncbi:hypothetical protein QOZ80_6BG0484750 [Eleusine coracana subsp. coracana]|nr:hypothetical protein QOZ80_6BG0484750 [Eleusine coracana subsp. coracana]
MARIGAIVALLALALLLVATAASAKGPTCCSDNQSWGDELTQTTGCSSNHQNNSCNYWCSAACRGGQCKIRGGKHVCHCYC